MVLTRQRVGRVDSRRDFILPFFEGSPPRFKGRPFFVLCRFSVSEAPLSVLLVEDLLVIVLNYSLGAFAAFVFRKGTPQTGARGAGIKLLLFKNEV